jgi:hypothetical protein
LRQDRLHLCLDMQEALHTVIRQPHRHRTSRPPPFRPQFKTIAPIMPAMHAFGLRSRRHHHHLLLLLTRLQLRLTSPVFPMHSVPQRLTHQPFHRLSSRDHHHTLFTGVTSTIAPHPIRTRLINSLPSHHHHRCLYPHRAFHRRPRINRSTAY